MSGANYEYCPVCDTKALYVGEDDVGDVVVLHQKCRERELAQAAAAERECIRHALLDCRACGKIHEPLRKPYPLAAPNWASPDDGHAYAPAYVNLCGSLGDIIRDLLDPAAQHAEPGEPGTIHADDQDGDHG